MTIVEEIHSIIDNYALSNYKKPVKPEYDEVLSEIYNKGFIKVPGAKEAFLIENNFLREMDIYKKFKYVDELQNKYPEFKIVHKSILNNICDKYGLYWGNVSEFKGIIPKKNQIDIAEFDTSLRSISSTDKIGYTKVNLMTIIAPKEDFEIQIKPEVSKLQRIEDPIVVYHLNRDAFIIVSKWGNEGNDQSIADEKMN